MKAESIPTKMGFTFQELVARYLYILSPSVQITETDPRTGLRDRHLGSIMIRWERLQNLLKINSPAMEKHKKKLFGHTLEVFGTDSYNLIELCSTESMPDYYIFKDFPVHLRAQYTAQHHLSNIVDIIRRHDEIVSDNVQSILDSKNK